MLGPTPAPTGGIALIASLSYATYQLKLEGMFAKAFQLQGLEPVVLVPSDSDVPRRYLETFGIRRFVTLDPYLGPERLGAAYGEQPGRDAGDQRNGEHGVRRGVRFGRPRDGGEQREWRQHADVRAAQ